MAFWVGSSHVPDLSVYILQMDDELMQNADVFVDSREGAMKESGDVIQSQCKVGRRLPSFFF